MATIKTYIKPCITIVAINNSNIICSSGGSAYICSEFCKFWHSCQDRREGKYCSDKKYY